MDAVLAGSMFLAALADTAFALVVGSFFADRWLAASGDQPPIHEAKKLLRQIRVAAALTLLLCHATRPWFVAASMSGSNSLIGNLTLFPDIIGGTHQGSLWYLNSVGLVLMLGSSFTVHKPVQIVAVLIMASAKAASGHAANDGDLTLAELSMWLHILGTSAWAGSIIAAGFIVLPRIARDSDLTTVWRFGGLLSQTVTWALLMLLISGIYTSNRELDGSLPWLWQSRWGGILSIKAAGVLLALALGARTRFQCLSRPATGERAASMVRWVRVEAVLMVMILGLSAVLAGTPPAASEFNDAGEHVHHHG